ncbi:unnamed protein product, partial [Hymenolepis diminuta]
MNRSMEIANLCLRALTCKTYYNLLSVEREIGNYARVMGIMYYLVIIRSGENDARQYVYYCQFRYSMECKAIFCVTSGCGSGPLEIAVYARHTHPCRFEPIEMDPSPYDIDPSHIQEEPVQLSEKMRRGRQFFQKMLNFLVLARASTTAAQYRRIFDSITKLTFREGVKLFDAL